MFALIGTGCVVPTEEASEDELSEGEPSETVGVAQQAVVAPSCVHFWQDMDNDANERVAGVQNRCKNAQRFRMIWRWAGDGPCVTLGSYESRYERRTGKWQKDPYVTELRKC
jgi:hypothetical protein